MKNLMFICTIFLSVNTTNAQELESVLLGEFFPIRPNFLQFILDKQLLMTQDLRLLVHKRKQQNAYFEIRN